jgi:tellurite resistance protein TehA-like permease
MSTADRNLTRLHRDWGLSPSTLAPGCFASVMATGIVSIGAQLKGLPVLSGALFWLAVALYLFFITLSVVRAVRFRESLRADLHDPTRAFGFFTAIAGTNVIATALVGLGMAPLALVLFGIGALLWLVLGYGIPFAAVLGSGIRPVVKGVNGTWFVWVVAAQSVAVVASSLALELPKSFPSPGLVVALTLVAVIMWAVGLALYIACALFVGMRVLLHQVRARGPRRPVLGDDGRPGDLDRRGFTDPRTRVHSDPRCHALLVGGSSALLWAFATWLIPSFVLAGAWRHFIHRVPMTYSAGLWSMVFPLGMYAVASMYLGRSDRVPPIEWIGQHWFWVGLRRLGDRLRPPWSFVLRPDHPRDPQLPAVIAHRLRTAQRPAGAAGSYRCNGARCDARRGVMVPAADGRLGGRAGQPATQASKRWPSGFERHDRHHEHDDAADAREVSR